MKAERLVKSPLFYLFVILILHLYFLMHLQFTAWPEMFAYPYLRNNGFLLYQDMIYPYPPLLTMFLANIYSLFRYSLEVLQITTWALILLSSFLVFLIIRLFTDKLWPCVFGVVFYAATQPYLEGNMLWFDLSIVPLVLAGLYFLISYTSKKHAVDLFLTGLFLGSAIFVKQTTGLFFIFTFLVLTFRRTRLSDLVIYLTGPLILGFALLIRLWQENSLNWFVNWTLVFPFKYWSKFPNYVQLSLSKQQIITLFILFSPLLLIFRTLKARNGRLPILLSYLAISLIIVYPRFSFFHLQMALALLAVIIGYLLAEIRLKSISLALFAYLAIIIWFIQRPVLATDWNKEARFYGPEDKALSNEINKKVGQNESVYLLGLNSNLYAIANRLPPKPWTDNFGWYLEIPGVQEEIIQKWEIDPPKYVFWQKPGNGNWFDLGTYQPQRIVEYIKANYNLNDRVSPTVTVWTRRS